MRSARIADIDTAQSGRSFCSLGLAEKRALAVAVFKSAAAIAVVLAGALSTASAELFPAELDLDSLLIANGGDGSVGFVLNGIDDIDQSGISVSLSGDVNSDGIGDLIVGAFNVGFPGGRFSAGQSYVVFGSTQGFAAEFEFSSLIAANGGDGSTGFALNGADQGDTSGTSVSDAGDVNGDGFDDIIIGATGGDSDGMESAGESYVVFGSDQGFAAEFELSGLSKTNGGDGRFGFIINGINEFDRSGRSVSAAGDVNGDGLSDLIIGAAQASPGGRGQAGQSYVVFGKNRFPAAFELSSLQAANGGDGSAGFIMNGKDEGSESGSMVSAAGDVNGDGVGDVIVGARLDTPPDGPTSAGSSYVIFGSTQGFPPEFELSSLLEENGGDGSAGFVLHGVERFDHLGISVGSAGDVNGDGIGDVIVGADFADPPGGQSNAGSSYVIFGNAQGYPAEIEVSSLLADNGGDGSVGFAIHGADSVDESGFSVSTAGDVNGDGLSDLVVGASRAGNAYVVFGTLSGFPAEVQLASLLVANGGDGSTGFALNGGPNTDTGFSVSAAGDINADGVGDVMVSAIRAGPLNTGRTYVIFGRLDTDGDGLGDDADNCIEVANSDQRDTDADGIGNICDADFNQDCIVHFVDFFIMRATLSLTGNLPTDMNGDFVVNLADLQLFWGGFMRPPGPSGVPNLCDM